MSKPSENNVATRGDVREIVNEVVVDASGKILEGVQKMFDEQDRKNEQKFATKEDLNNVKTEIKTDIRFLKEDVEGLKADLSATVSREEFEKVKGRVTRLELRSN